MGNFIQPIRSSTQIWVVTRHQYGISALVSQTSFDGETSGSVAKCRLFSQATGGGGGRGGGSNPGLEWCIIGESEEKIDFGDFLAHGALTVNSIITNEYRLNLSTRSMMLSEGPFKL